MLQVFGDTFHQKFLCGLKPPPSGGKKVVDKTAEPVKSFSVTPSLWGEAIRTTPIRRLRSQSADGATVD